MSEVTLKIGGRSYNVACQDGEEAHILHLGSLIAEKIDAMGDNRSPQESQNLLFASLFLADELHEARAAAEKSDATLFEANENEELRRKLGEAEAARDALSVQVRTLGEQLSAPKSSPPSEEIAALLEEVAGKLEKCADTLEGGSGAS